MTYLKIPDLDRKVGRVYDKFYDEVRQFQDDDNELDFTLNEDVDD